LVERAAGRLSAYRLTDGPTYGLDLDSTVECCRRQVRDA
jgi:hypothetical protein